MEELFPVVGGGLLGLAFAARAWPRWFQAVAVLVMGGFAASISGEFSRSWIFSLIDCAETAAAAWIVTTVCRARPWRILFADHREWRRQAARRLAEIDGRGG